MNRIIEFGWVNSWAVYLVSKLILNHPPSDFDSLKLNLLFESTKS